MKKNLHTVLKLLLVLAIFLGLQGRVLVRYAEGLHKNQKKELAHSANTKIKAGIVHRNLQCYTQHFQELAIPPIANFFSLITAPLLTGPPYIPFREKLCLADPVRLLPLRAPPVV
jgi:hypothetical protein